MCENVLDSVEMELLKMQKTAAAVLKMFEVVLVRAVTESLNQVKNVIAEHEIDEMENVQNTVE
jgi:hypothetical protein